MPKAIAFHVVYQVDTTFGGLTRNRIVTRKLPSCKLSSHEIVFAVFPL